MKDTISKRDWETISAYLDGQLSSRKQARLESRLQQDQKLCLALEELRDTRQVLRSAPRLRAPRSFMLTPEMAGQPRRLPNLAPLFGWASAVASFLLVLFLVGDLFTTGGAIPIALSNFTQQQQESVALKGEVAENGETEQVSSDAADLETAAQPMAIESASEIPEGDAPVETAAIPEEEAAAPVVEQAASRELDPQEPLQDPVTEEPAADELDESTQAEVTPTRKGPDTSVAFESATEEVAAQPEEPKATEVVEVAQTEEPKEEVDDFVQVASITETLPTETIAVEVSEAPLQEEALSADENLQPAAQVIPTATLFQPAAEMQAEPTLQSDWGYAETANKPKTDDYIIGVETVLALLAVGTGLAWLYLRRRGG
jgi:hypothetical protein